MGHYEMVPTLVKQMREVRREHELAFEMMVGTTQDLLRYDLKNVVRKFAVRRAVEKAFKKPYYEVPGIYSLSNEKLENWNWKIILLQMNQRAYPGDQCTIRKSRDNPLSISLVNFLIRITIEL